MKAFFEKYGKIIMAIMSVGLMMIWMMPSKGSGDAERDSAVIGTLAGKKITNSDLSWARAELVLLTPLARGSQQIAAVMHIVNPRMGQGEEDIPRNADLHFYLLGQEAIKYNLVATPDEINQLKANLGLTNDNYDNLFKNTHVDRSVLQPALADVVAIGKLNELAYAGLRPSLPELRYVAAQTRSRVSVAYTLFDANTPIPNLPAPTPAEIAAQFAAYKDIVALPGQTPLEINGHHFPFGYKYADRVKVEWLAFNHLAMRALIADSLTPEQQRSIQLDAYHYYTAHPDEFTATPPTTTNPATAPATPALKPFTDPEVAKKLIDKQLDSRADEVLHQMAEEAIKLAGDPWKAGVDDKGFREKIDPKEWADYKKIADALAVDPRFKKYRPDPAAPSPWADQTILPALPGIGKSYYLTQVRGYPFTALALSVREIDTKTKDPELRLLQIGVEGHILTDADGNLYVYRVVDAEPSHTPASADEVQDKIISDLQKKKTFDIFTQRAAKLASQAVHEGLEAVVAGYHADAAFARSHPADPANYLPNLTVEDLPAFTRMVDTRMSNKTTGLPEIVPVDLPKLGVLPQFTDAAFRLAQQPAAPAAATSPTSTAPSTTFATTSLAVDERFNTFAIQLLHFDPMSQNDFDLPGTRTDMTEIAEFQALRGFVPKWNTLESSAKRMNFVPAPDYSLADD